MTSVRYQLRCENSLTQSPLPPLVWFKDRGGKRNTIEIPIRLVSSSGETVLGKNVPLLVELIYKDGELVPDQSLLEIKNESRLGPTGKCLLRIRIKEVSVRHSGKHFALKISPDIFKDPSSVDISTVVSFTIEVKSKIANSSVTSSSSAAYHSTLSSSSTCSRQKRPLNDQASYLYGEPTPVSAIGRFHPPPPAGHQQIDQSRKSPKLHSSSSPSQSNSPSPSFLPISDLDLAMPAIALPPVAQQGSMNKLDLWAFNVINQLEKMKWKLVGHEATSSLPRSMNGLPPAVQPSSSSSVPVYEMSNPNQMIDAMVAQYYAIQAEIEDSSCRSSNMSESPVSQLSHQDQNDRFLPSEESDKDFPSFPESLDASYPLNSLSLLGALWEFH